jgi:succinate dehydrogenase / fumarate reductase cytochrome b subunit
MSANSPAPGTPQRPLSPFMIGPYYKPQLTSMLSITHRLTGLAMAFGTVFVTAWVMSAAAGAESYACFTSAAKSILGRLLMFAFSWALLYHLCNGIRHLFWDMGRGFELKDAYTSGYTVVAASAALTVLTWIVALA